MLTRKVLTLTMGAVMLLLCLVGGCKPKTFTAPPYIPSGYYDCIETLPVDLVHAYFAGYGEIWSALENYNDKVFVFKNLLVDEWMVYELDKGILWLDLIKCYLANPEAMDNYKLGDRIDVVGFNQGPDNIKVTGLTFRDCYVLPPGAIALPAEGNGQINVGY